MFDIDLFTVYGARLVWEELLPFSTVVYVNLLKKGCWLGR